MLHVFYFSEIWSSNFIWRIFYKDNHVYPHETWLVHFWFWNEKPKAIHEAIVVCKIVFWSGVGFISKKKRDIEVSDKPLHYLKLEKFPFPFRFSFYIFSLYRRQKAVTLITATNPIPWLSCWYLCIQAVVWFSKFKPIPVFWK